MDNWCPDQCNTTRALYGNDMFHPHLGVCEHVCFHLYTAGKTQRVVLRLRSWEGEGKVFQNSIQITPQTWLLRATAASRGWAPHILAWVPVTMEVRWLSGHSGTQRQKLTHFLNTNAGEGPRQAQQHMERFQATSPELKSWCCFFYGTGMWGFLSGSWLTAKHRGKQEEKPVLPGKGGWAKLLTL